jgi:hypothetical protein
MASELQMNDEYKELLSLFAKHRARYLVVGAYAVMRYTEPRYTKDLDVWVDSAPDNAVRVFKALVEYGVPLKGLSPKDFTGPYGGYQIGVEPIRIDILAHVDGVRFSSAWSNLSESPTCTGGKSATPLTHYTPPPATRAGHGAA